MKKKSRKPKAKKWVPEGAHEFTLLADGFEEAFVGITTWSCGRVEGVAIYDYDKCLQILMKRDGMSAEDAIDYMGYNVCGAWVGEHTPIFISLAEKPLTKHEDDIRRGLRTK